MSEALTGNLVVSDLDHQFRRERMPRTFLAVVPAAVTAGRLAGETWFRD